MQMEILMAQPGTPDDERTALALSITEFCRRHGISRATYYNLRTAGLAPVEMKVFGRRLISAESAAEWRRQRETDSTAA
jgi:hypothetical protein